MMQTGTSRYGRQLLAVPAVRRDGARLSIEFHVVVLHDPAGVVAGVAAIIRDVTERWERERALRQRVQDLEAGQAEQEGPGPPRSEPARTSGPSGEWSGR